ncbi:MAG: tryptophanyl-tRNA synthetase [Myxococcota bacterium]|jgi:tryptophanyl-tRNA synthetase
MPADNANASKTPTGPRRSLSGIKSTGSPHLGNYLGMIRPAIALQETHEAFYFVADYHALTTERDPEAMRRSTLEVTATFLACGLDPSRGAFFRQSDVPEVTELSWLLSCITTMGELERGHAYKARAASGEAGTAVHGLFAYPVLMAADILIYDSHVVPVGKDQVQHVEMARDMAKRFNHHFGETFVIPEAQTDAAVMTIPGIDGRKMSKSYKNGIDIFQPRKKLKKRLMQVVTDSTPLEAPKNPDGDNVIALYRFFASDAEVAEMEANYRRGGYGYGHAKVALFEAMDAHLGPMRERYDALMANPSELEDVLQAGARKARAVAQEVMGRARARCGYPTRPVQMS